MAEAWSLALANFLISCQRPHFRQTSFSNLLLKPKILGKCVLGPNQCSLAMEKIAPQAHCLWNARSCHGPQSYYVNISQRNSLCNCNCNVAAKIILKAIIYVILPDAFVSCETEAHAKIISLENCFCNCSCNCNPARNNSLNILLVCNVLWTTVLCAPKVLHY